MAKPTSARDRSKRRASRRPTSSATRAARSRASSNSNRVTQSGQGGRGARVTSAARRANTGSARVTTSTRPALPPGKKGGPLAKTESARRQAARARLRGAGQGTTGGTRMGKPGAGGPKTQPRLTGTKTAGQRIRSSGYADDIRSLKRAVKAGGQAAKKAAAKLLKLGIRYVPATKSFVKVAATRGGKAAPGMIIGGKIAASAGTRGAAQMSKLGITRNATKSGDAPVYRTPLNKVGRSQATSRKVGPEAVKGGYTISKEAREKAKVSRGNSTKTDSTPAQSKLTKKDPTPAAPKVTAPPKQRQTGDRNKDMATWAKANRKMIEKVGTKAQRAILARVDAQQKKKKRPDMSGTLPSNRTTA